MKKEKKKLMKEDYVKLGIATLCMLFAFLFPLFTPIRFFSCLLAIFLCSRVTYSFLKSKKNYFIFLLLGYLFCFMCLDAIVCFSFHRIPIFSYNIITENNTRVYNALGITVWQCDTNRISDLYVQPFYKKGYACNPERMSTLDVNTFSFSLEQNYDSYKNNYIKLQGKISNKNGMQYLEMQPFFEDIYESEGTVLFDSSLTIRVLFTEEEPALDTYQVEDDITVVGIIKNKEVEDGVTTLYLYDSKLISLRDMEEYTLSYTSLSACQDKKLLYEGENVSVYSYCITDILLSYDANNQYELESLLEEGTISASSLYKNLSFKKNNKSILYEGNIYRILVCDSSSKSNVIIGDTTLTFSDLLCK